MPAYAARWDPFRSVAFSSITNSYAALGTPTTHLMRILKIVNSTNADVDISFDGTTNNDFIPANSFVLYDIQSNSESGNDFFLQLNTQIYIKYDSGAPTSGSVHVIAVYGKGQ